MKRLTDTEWIIMRALWGKEPQTLKNIITSIQRDEPGTNWNYKTYHTFLRNMCEKELISCEVKNARDNYYSAKISRTDALKAESKSLISRISGGSVGELIALMAEDGQLTERDQQELLDLADRLENEVKRGD